MLGLIIWGEDFNAWHEIPAFTKLGLEMSEESMELTGIHEEIDMAAGALQ